MEIVLNAPAGTTVARVDLDKNETIFYGQGGGVISRLPIFRENEKKRQAEPNPGAREWPFDNAPRRSVYHEFDATPEGYAKGLNKPAPLTCSRCQVTSPAIKKTWLKDPVCESCYNEFIAWTKREKEAGQ